MSQVSAALAVYRAGADNLLEKVTAYAAEQNITLTSIELDLFLKDPAAHLADSRHVVAVVNDADLSRVIHDARLHDFSVGMVPLHQSSVTYRLFELPRKLPETLALAFDSESSAVDVALCNDEVVLGMVMLGDTPFLDQRSKGYVSTQPTWRSRAWYLIRSFFVSVAHLFGIRPFPVTLTTGKDVEIRTAITGMVLVENDAQSAAARLVNASTSSQDGKVSAVLIAPTSVTEYLAFLFIGMLQRRRQGKKLPGAVSFIKSDRLTLQAGRALTYFVDGRRREADTLAVLVEPRAVRINCSAAFHARQEAGSEKKDTMRTENLPQNEARVEMIQKHLPFFTRAVEDDFKDLFLLLRDNARIRNDFVTLMILSSVVAVLGLFLDSAAVIIGAMVLAPLMAPIISLSMGALRNDSALLKDSAVSIAVGMGLALLASALVTLIIPLEKITPEINGRLQPSLLDLGVAVGSGIAGAYAHARENVMKSLPGVAIAVALVPPLCVAGIGVGWLDWHVISGAMLLFLTNLVGITLAGVVTFMVLGYAPIKRATRGLGWTMLLLVLISIPLGISFNNIKHHWQIENQLLSGQYVVHGKLLRLSNITVTLRQPDLLIRADAASASRLEPDDVRALKEQLTQEFGRPVSLEIAYRLAL